MRERAQLGQLVGWVHPNYILVQGNANLNVQE